METAAQIPDISEDLLKNAKDIVIDKYKDAFRLIDAKAMKIVQYSKSPAYGDDPREKGLAQLRVWTYSKDSQNGTTLYQVDRDSELSLQCKVSDISFSAGSGGNQDFEVLRKAIEYVRDALESAKTDDKEIKDLKWDCRILMSAAETRYRYELNKP